jgi:hydrogenase-4 component E
MSDPVSAVLVVILLQNIFVLGSSRIRTIIYTVALQGVILSTLPVLLHHAELGVIEVLVSVGALVLKGVVIPKMLMRAMTDLPIRREIEPLVGFRASIVLGGIGLMLSIYLAFRLPMAEPGGTAARMFVAASFSTILTGLQILTTRVKALTQVLGYLMLENGIYIFGVLLLKATPFLVEVGVLLDLFVAVFVMGIMINHISREFTSISTEHLTKLRD